MEITIKLNMDKVTKVIASWVWLQALNAIVALIVSFCTGNKSIAEFSVILWISAIALAIVGFILCLVSIRYNAKHHSRQN